MTDNLDIVKANYSDSKHAVDIVALMDDYARDAMGGGEPLSIYSRQYLVAGLAKTSGAVTFLAYNDDRPIGIATAIPGFSTFAAKPLLNIHDLAVIESCRGRGVSQLLLAGIERIALERGCCKVTLEVLEGNLAARQAYEKFGFSSYKLNSSVGNAMFWQKIIT